VRASPPHLNNRIRPSTALRSGLLQQTLQQQAPIILLQNQPSDRRIGTKITFAIAEIAAKFAN